MLDINQPSRGRSKPPAAEPMLRRSIRNTLQRSDWGRGVLEARRDRVDARQRERGVAFYRDFVAAGDLCFDIGANVGNRTELLREIGARVVSLEPQGPCVERLRRKFGDDHAVVIVPSAVGSSPGTAEISVCDDDSTIATMSSRWQSEGRFADRTWTRSESVPVTTMDHLIAEHGSPSFCKIDVEGFERQVLEGLSSPVRCISFEFTREFLDDARTCVALLENLGPIEVNASFGETMRLAERWVAPTKIFSTIEAQPDDRDWGDIYVRSR
jgi:FkbM family methyltransferase